MVDQELDELIAKLMKEKTIVKDNQGWWIPWPFSENQEDIIYNTYSTPEEATIAWIALKIKGWVK